MVAVKRIVYTLLLVVMTGGVVGCGGAGPGMQSLPLSASSDTSAARTITLRSRPTSVALASIAGLSTTLLFPAVSTATTLGLSVSATPPAGVTLAKNRHTLADFGIDIYEYITLTPATTTTLPVLPAMSFTFPATTVLDGRSIFFGVSDPVAQAGSLAAFLTEGPAKINGNTATVGAVARPLVLQAGHRYTFIVYAYAISAQLTSPTLFVADAGTNALGVPVAAPAVLTFRANGAADLAPITSGLVTPVSVAVGANGMAYVLDTNDDTVKTYTLSGARGALTLALPAVSGRDVFIGYAGLGVAPDGTIAVSTTGLCELACSYGHVLRYAADGTALNTIDLAPFGMPNALAIDSTGNILTLNYVGSVIRYAPDGSSQTTVVSGLQNATALAVDAHGRIYVVAGKVIHSYNADGSPRAVSITTAFAPGAIAVDAAGKVYVVDAADEQIVSYNADGSPAAPTINTGAGPVSLTVH